MVYSVGWRAGSDVRWRRPREIGINAVISANEGIRAQNGVGGDQGERCGKGKEAGEGGWQRVTEVVIFRVVCKEWKV